MFSLLVMSSEERLTLTTAHWAACRLDGSVHYVYSPPERARPQEHHWVARDLKCDRRREE